MMGAVRMQQQLGLEKFESLPVHERHKVLFEVNVIAKDRGFKSEGQLRQEKPYLWNQFVAEVVAYKFF